MKKFFLVIVSILLTMTTFAQNKQESQHLSFKGVPIDGTLKAYTEAMKSAGFTYLGTQDGIALLQGDFAGYRGCTIGVATLKKLDLVSTIAVIFPDQETWSGLYSNYSFLKEMLTKKYGKPSDEAERFDSAIELVHVFDLKTGGARLTPQQVKHIQTQTQKQVPVTEIRGN